MLRHGESQWNLENRFTGWVDVPLSELGQREAQAAGKLLKDEGFTFDAAYTSVLKRAIKTLWIVLEELDRMWIPVTRSWRINERMYGGLQGLNKAETVALHGGEDQVKICGAASYDVPPPALDEGKRSIGPARIRATRASPPKPDELPKSECLKDTVNRFLPFWESEIAPAVKRGQRVIIAAHGNSLRALVKHLDGVSDDAIVDLNIPTGIPLVYELDDQLRPTKPSYYLGDPEAAEKAAKAVANQLKG